MSIVRKSLEQIKKEGGGKIDQKKVDSFTDADAERMAREDGEPEHFPEQFVNDDVKAQKTVYLANVSKPGGNTPSGSQNLLFVTLAASEDEASETMQAALGEGWTIEFRRHDLDEDETVARLGLGEGKARSLA